MEQYRKRPSSKRGSIWPALSGKIHQPRPTALGSTWPPRDFALVSRHMMEFDSSPIPQVPKELSPSSHSGTAPNGEAALVAVLDLLADGSWKCPQTGQVPQPARRRDKTVGSPLRPALCWRLPCLLVCLFPRNGSTASKPPSRDHQPNPVRGQPEVSIPRLITLLLLPCCPALPCHALSWPCLALN